MQFNLCVRTTQSMQYIIIENRAGDWSTLSPSTSKLRNYVAYGVQWKIKRT